MVHELMFRKKTKLRLCPSYCWWTKSCTSWYGKYPSIYRRYLYIPGGAGFFSISSIVILFSQDLSWDEWWNSPCFRHPNERVVMQIVALLSPYAIADSMMIAGGWSWPFESCDAGKLNSKPHDYMFHFFKLVLYSFACLQSQPMIGYPLNSLGG